MEKRQIKEKQFKDYKAYTDKCKEHYVNWGVCALKGGT